MRGKPRRVWVCGLFGKNFASGRLVYFGARYYDPRTSVWQSADPILEKYLPNRLDPAQLKNSFDPEQDLAGMGGVYNSLNLALYTYTHQNPVKLVDPDGREPLGAVIKLLQKGGEKFVRWVSSKAEAVQARKQGETVVMETRQQAKQVEEAVAGGDKSKVMRHKGHELKDESKGRPHYQTEGKEGHSMWGKLGAGAAATGGGLVSNDNAEASTAEPASAETNSGSTLENVGNFLMDLVIPGGVTPLGEGSDKVPTGGREQKPATTDQ